jgi:hypothetical protein
LPGHLSPPPTEETIVKLIIRLTVTAEGGQDAPHVEDFESWADALYALQHVYGRPAIRGTYTITTHYA